MWTTYRRTRTLPKPRATQSARKSRLSVARWALWSAAACLAFVIYIDSADSQRIFDGTLLQWPIPAFVLGLMLAACIGLEIVVVRGRADSIGFPVTLSAMLGSGGAAIFFARLARGSAGALAIVCSVFYLAVALFILPPRAKIDAAVEHTLQIGEVAAMREQLGLQSRTTPK